MRRSLIGFSLIVLTWLGGSLSIDAQQTNGLQDRYAQNTPSSASPWSAIRKFKAQFGTSGSKESVQGENLSDRTTNQAATPNVVFENAPTRNSSPLRSASNDRRRVRPLRGAVDPPRRSTNSQTATRRTSEPSAVAPAPTSSRRQSSLVPQVAASPAYIQDSRSEEPQRQSIPTPREDVEPPRTIIRRNDTAEPTKPANVLRQGSSSSTATPQESGLADSRSEAPEDGLLFSRKSPILSVQTLGPRQTVIGKESTFKVRLQNLGEASADAVIVRVNTPSWAQIASAQASRGIADTATTDDDQPLEWRVERLDPRSSELLTLRIIPQKSDPFDLGVAWTFSPVASQALIQVQEPKLALQIDGPGEVRYGDTEVYRLQVSNPGTGNAEDVQLQLMPLEGGDHPMAVQRVGIVEAGSNKVLEIELTARQTGFLNVKAIVVGDGGLKAEASERVLVRRAALSVDAAAPELKYAGTIATFQFHVANPGNATAENLTIVASLPPGAEYIDSLHGGKLDKDSGRVSWTISSLAAQNDKDFQVRAILSKPGANNFRVSAEADDELAASSTATTEVEALADLKLDISDPRGPLPVDEEMVYEVRITNRGTKAAQDVETIAFFSEGIEPVSVIGGSHELGVGQVVFKAIPTLAVGAEVTYKIIARASSGGDHVFRAEVHCEKTGIRLAAEEMTRFYENHAVTARRPEKDPAAPRSSALPGAYRIPR